MMVCTRIATRFVAFLLLGTAVGCGAGGSGSTTTPPSISVILSSSATAVYQNQSSVLVSVLLTRTGTTGNVMLTLQGVPPSVSTRITSPMAGNSGSVVFTALAPTTPPNLGNFTVTITANDGQVSGSAATPLSVGAYVQVASHIISPLQLAMSTSFQPAEWDYQLFTNHPGVRTSLNNLQASHIRLQPVSQGVPESAQDVWDFTILDSIVQPVLNAGDQKPEFQIAVAPAFMKGSPNFDADFATYAAQLVKYYNKGGFVANGKTYQSSSVDAIKLWGIFNEPNYNNFNPAQYAQLYNTAVPAMQAVDNSIKFVAVELGDSPGEVQAFLPAFISGVTAQVDVLATHLYSSCNQKDSDQEVFNTVPGFASEVQNIYLQLGSSGNSGLKTVPVWVTENNVNADFDMGGGISACNGTAFVTDQRGSSAFFAAWRPYVFSQLGKANAAALYQWVYAGDAQYGEIDDQTGSPRLSYWVDYWLQHKFPPSGATILDQIATDDAELETLAVQNSDNSVVVMVANHALNATTDNNGPGAPRSVLVDVSQLSTMFQTAKLLTIDAHTNLTNGPSEATVGLGPQIPINFNGYGVALLTLK
jgi:hypothetical protein